VATARTPRSVSAADASMRHDAGVGVRAAQHLAVQHTGQLDIGAVDRAPRHLVYTIRAQRAAPMTL
jgi:hypothetical protein